MGGHIKLLCRLNGKDEEILKAITTMYPPTDDKSRNLRVSVDVSFFF